jgi:probable phosphoglycerate mutase
LKIKQVTTILLIRHGMTAAVGHRLTGWAPGVHINDAGREQVAKLGLDLAGIPLQAIYSSPLERARETAEAVAGHHRLEIQYRERLGEVRVGEWTGKLLTELEDDPQWREWNLSRATARTPKGETFLELQNRVTTELMDIAHAHPDGIVAAVSHADPIRAALMQFLGMPGDFCLRLEVGPASVSVLQIARWGPRVLSVNIPVGGIRSLL